MAYAFQTFGSGQVLTKGQTQQIEDNIRDHVHGQGGVGASGLNWAVGSATASFLAVQSMTSALTELSGDFTVTLDAPATLGKGWSNTYVNIGSGRIALKPSAGTIDNGNSQFILTPKASINVLSDGADFKLFGQTRGWFTLWDMTIAASTQLVVVDKMFPGDFSLYQLRMDDLVVSSGGDYIKSFVSEDSGATFTTSGYKHSTDADTTWMRLTSSTIQSNECLQAYGWFTNRAVVGNALFFDTFSVERNGAGLAPSNRGDENIGAPVTNIVNAMRCMPGSRGFMIAGRISLMGLRR